LAICFVLFVQHDSDHTSEHLAEETRAGLNEWGISLTDIQGLVADNTASMPALAHELGITFKGCDAHKLNLVVSHSLIVVESTRSN